MTENKELHYRYVVSYLLAALILLVALKYYDVPSLFDKFSFALTLSSLLLAILAIFYTIISAQKQDMQLTKLIETNTSLDRAALEIKSASQDIRLFAQEAPHHFQTIGQKLDYISENYGTLKTSIETQVEGVIITDEKPINITKIQFSMMVCSLQFSAMAVLYLFMKSYCKGQSIEPEVFEKIDLDMFDYAIGFLNGIESTGLISYKIHKGAIMPISCSEVVIEDIQEHLLRVVKVASPKDSERLSSLMAAIEAHVA